MPMGAIIKKIYKADGSTIWVPIQEYEKLRQVSTKKNLDGIGLDKYGAYIQ